MMEFWPVLRNNLAVRRPCVSGCPILPLTIRRPTIPVAHPVWEREGREIGIFFHLGGRETRHIISQVSPPSVSPSIRPPKKKIAFFC